MDLNKDMPSNNGSNIASGVGDVHVDHQQIDNNDDDNHDDDNHDDNHEQIEAMKIVKSILKKNSSEKFQEKPNTVSVIQRWWKSNTQTNAKKTQQEILSTMKQNKETTTTSTTTNTGNTVVTTTSAAAVTTSSIERQVQQAIPEDESNNIATQQQNNTIKSDIVEPLSTITIPAGTDQIPIIDTAMIDSLLEIPPSPSVSIAPLPDIVTDGTSAGSKSIAATQKRSYDIIDQTHLQHQRLKKIAAKTILSQKHTSSITNVAAMMEPSRTTATSNNNSNNNNNKYTKKNRPPLEVTIETPIKKEYKNKKTDTKNKPKNQTKTKATATPINKKSATVKKPSIMASVTKKKQQQATVDTKKRASTTATTENKNKNGDSNASNKRRKSTGTIFTPTTTTTTTTTSATKKGSNLVWEGKPTEALSFTMNWDGWIKRTYERQNGISKGSRDSYWYTPQQQYKLRSLKEIERYMQHYNENGKDELKAIEKMKQRK